MVGAVLTLVLSGSNVTISADSCGNLSLPSVGLSASFVKYKTPSSAVAVGTTQLSYRPKTSSQKGFGVRSLMMIPVADVISWKIVGSATDPDPVLKKATFSLPKSLGLPTDW